MRTKRFNWCNCRSPSTLFTADSVLIEDPNSDSAEIVDVEILPVSEGSFPGERILTFLFHFNNPRIFILNDCVTLDQYIHRSSFDGSPVGSEEANDTTRLWNPTRWKSKIRWENLSFLISFILIFKLCYISERASVSFSTEMPSMFGMQLNKPFPGIYLDILF